MSVYRAWQWHPGLPRPTPLRPLSWTREQEMLTQRSYVDRGKRLRAALYCAAGMIAPEDKGDLEILRIFAAFTKWKPGARKSLKKVA